MSLTPGQRESPSEQVEQLLYSRQVGDLPEHFVLPHYDAYSIVNLASTIGKLLRVSVDGAAPALPEPVWSDLADNVNCVVLLVLDAVGYRQFQRYLEDRSSVFTQLSGRGRLLPITSVFPSTTVSALTSIWTGHTPLGHGFLGTKLLLPEQGVLANMLKMAPAVYSRGGSLEQWGWEPETFVSVPSLPGQLAHAGVKTVAHTRLSFIGSTLTRILLRGIDDLQGYVNLSDLWINLRRTLTERVPEEPLFVDVYWGGADNVGHVYGPDDEYGRAALHHLARSLEEDFLNLLPAQARDATLLMVTADHGQIATPAEEVVHLPDHPALWETMLLPPAGESRASYLYVRPGQESRLDDYTRDHLDGDFVLLDTERALEIGLWGPKRLVAPISRARLGDRLLIARDGSRLSRRTKEEDKGALRGHHGSLTPEEMLVPLLLTRLDQL